MLRSTPAVRSILMALSIITLPTLPALAQKTRAPETTGSGPTYQNRSMSRQDRLPRTDVGPGGYDYNSLYEPSEFCTLGNTAGAPQECERMRLLQPKGNID